MKKKIAIIGSTGSIGKTLIDILEINKKRVKIVLLTTNTNYKLLFKQAINFNVKNIIVSDLKAYEKAKKLITKKSKINIFNHFNYFKILKKTRIDYSMCAISGIAGLLPTINLIQFSKKIAIANKESIICGWKFIKKKLKNYNCEFVPVDSEHFSIWFAIRDFSSKEIEEIYLTASGGPFLNLKLENFKTINVNSALNHPNWNMGKKISIDSSTMMNKVFEIIEANKIFSIPFKNIKIIIHPKSYVHALIKFKNGMIKIIAHDTTMNVPIYNTIDDINFKNRKTKNINIDKLNELNFKKLDILRFPITKVLKSIPDKNSLFDTVIVSLNDELVKMFLEKKIKFNDIAKLYIKFINSDIFSKYKRIEASNITDIINLDNYVRLKLKSLMYI